MCKWFKYGIFVLAVVLFSIPAWSMGPEHEHEGGVKGLTERLEKVENALEKAGITFSGAVEAEATYVDEDGETETSDLVLATVELGVDINPAKHVSGHVLFLFEEDDTEDVTVDEGFIRLDGEDVIPFYLNVGRLYVPFGYFESHFISDPLTLELAETQESAVVAGYSTDMFEISIGLFNGDVNETDDEDDHIDDLVASAMFTLPENNTFGLMVGASYINNISESDTLEGEDGVDSDINTIAENVGGFSAFISASLYEKLFLEVEYVTALDSFEAEELGFDGGNRMEPSAYNIELAYLLTDDIELALRYAGSSDAGDLLPEKQYGAVVNWSFLDGVSLGLEIQHGEFDTPTDSDVLTMTAQLALDF
jgi:hypothetical protein